MKLPRRVVAATLLAIVLAACSDGRESVHPYDPAPVPAVPDRTAEVPETGSLANGYYWATLGTSDPQAGTVTVKVVQAFFADACVEQFGAGGCDNDMAVQAQPTRDVTFTADELGEVTVVAADRRNYAVPPTEFVALAAGVAPSADAPEGFEFQPYPMLLILEDGAATVVHQIWIP